MRSTLPLVFARYWPTGPWHHPEHGTEIDPLGRENGVPITGRPDAKGRIRVSEEFVGEAAGYALVTAPHSHSLPLCVGKCSKASH
jgi:hypothetical protein